MTYFWQIKKTFVVENVNFTDGTPNKVMFRVPPQGTATKPVQNSSTFTSQEKKVDFQYSKKRLKSTLFLWCESVLMMYLVPTWP